MGIAMAREAFRRGAQVTLVHGPLASSFALPSGVEQVPVTTAAEMYDAVVGRVFKNSGALGFDLVVMAAAVADFRPSEEAREKIKKASKPSSIDLAPNKDIVQELGERRGDSDTPVLVGFAVETSNSEALLAEAKSKLERKNLDFVVGNLANDSFDKDTNQVWVVSRGKPAQHVQTSKKRVVARRIWDHLCERQS
jgi:phosphopantothenoylcysteine decarboxylase/phosphopantothenate--cysteine ligase